MITRRIHPAACGRRGRRLRAAMLAPATVFALWFTCASAPAAARNPVTFAFSGEVTSVEDTLNWFQGTYAVGAPVAGTITYYDADYNRLTDPGDPGSVLYQFPAAFNPDMRITSGGRTVRTGPTSIPLSFQVIVNDNYAGEFDLPGDVYRVGSPVAFPDFFRNWAGDPVADPNSEFSPFTLMNLALHDPDGQALSSLDLPLNPPDLSPFETRQGRVVIGDINGGENYAVASFRVDTLTVVPEPAATGLVVLLASLRLSRRSRGRHRNTACHAGPWRPRTSRGE